MTPPAAIDAFFRGAFGAWLEGRQAGEELHLVEEREAVYVQVSTTETAQEVRVMADDLASSRRPRQKGARALKECLAVVRGGRRLENPSAEWKEYEERQKEAGDA